MVYSCLRCLFLVAADAVIRSMVAWVVTGASGISFLASKICIYLIIATGCILSLLSVIRSSGVGSKVLIIFIRL